MDFKRKETPTFNNGYIVRYTTGEFEISASRHGIMFRGASDIISDEKELETLALYVAKSWQEFKKMREHGISMEQTE